MQIHLKTQTWPILKKKTHMSRNPWTWGAFSYLILLHFDPWLFSLLLQIWSMVRGIKENLTCCTSALYPAPGTVFSSYPMVCPVSYRLKWTFPSPPNSLIMQKYKNICKKLEDKMYMPSWLTEVKKDSTLGGYVIWQYSLKQELIQQKNLQQAFFFFFPSFYLLNS